MTTMTAKYAGYCTACVGPIRVGAQIDYAPTTKARHIDCANRAPVPGRVAPVAPAPKKASSRKPSAPRAPAYPVSAPAPGAVTIGGRRDGRSDVRYSVGDVVVYDVRAGAKYGVVLARVMSAPNEDMGHYSWTESAWVRPATETEAAPVRARRAAAESVELAPKLLARLVTTEGHSVPEEQATLETVAPRAEVAWEYVTPTKEVVRVLESGALVSWHGGHYDDYRQSARVVARPSALLLATLAACTGDTSVCAVVADAAREIGVTL